MASDSEALAVELNDQINIALQALTEALDQLSYADLEARKPGQLPIDHTVEKILAMVDGIARYGEWVRITVAARRLEASGLTDLLDMLDKNRLPLEAAAEEFIYATAEARWRVARQALPILKRPGAPESP